MTFKKHWKKKKKDRPLKMNSDRKDVDLLGLFQTPNQNVGDLDPLLTDKCCSFFKGISSRASRVFART